MASDTRPEGEVWTIGHSTHTFPAFLDLLRGHGIETVADVRRFPGSRRHPQFGGEALSSSLEANGIAYHWFSGLGGRRRPDLLEAEGSAWRHPSFRAYAQHLRSEEFAHALESLLHAAKACRTVIMGAGECTTHRLAPPVRVTPAGLSYAGPDLDDMKGCC